LRQREGDEEEARDGLEVVEYVDITARMLRCDGPPS
jgi:hypothetical protein